jgi:hypothetical protein
VLGTVDGWKTTTANTPVIRADGGDGGWFAPGSLAPRVLTLKGAFRAGTERQLDDAEEQLRAALEHTTTDQTLWVGGASPRQVTVRLTGAVEVDDAGKLVRVFSAVMTAADPFKYAAGAAGLRVHTAGLQQISGLPGMVFPVGFPLDFGGADISGGRITLVNPGRTVWPVVTFTGPGPNLQLRHLELGQAVGYAPLMVPGQEVAFDHGSRAVTGDGRSLYTQRAPGTVFFPLLPGVNSLSFAADAYDTAARVTVAYRPRWT